MIKLTKFIIIPDNEPQKSPDSIFKNMIDNRHVDKNTSDKELESISKKLVNFNIEKPKNSIKFLPVPHVKHGFENSCSECSAESVIRYWQVKGYSHLVGWNQFTMHRAGYQTFEGDISEGDRGLFNLFKLLNLKVIEDNSASLSDIKKWISCGIPPIVRITTDHFRQNQHTQVAIGYSKSQIYLNDNDVFSSRNAKFNIESQKEFLKGFTGKILVVYPEQFKLAGFCADIIKQKSKVKRS